MACAGAVNWLWGWCYLALVGGLQAFTATALVRRDPDLLAERSRLQAGTKDWDRVIAPLVALAGPLATLVVAGLDHRWSWSAAMAPAAHAAAFVTAAGGGLIVVWAMLSNHFFASTVRIQTDRGHRVVDAGPYRLVRHPGYAGMLLFTFSGPFVLGSWWAGIVALVTAGLFVVRTYLEDRTLAAELPGYAEYQMRVRWRLVPYVW